MLLLSAVAHAVVKLAWLCFAHAISETVEKKVRKTAVAIALLAHPQESCAVNGIATPRI